MSMISAQIDELRAMAQLKKSLEKPAEARILDDAADTIWQLRDGLQRANAENAKLRDEFDKMDKWHSAELIAEMDENAKLRELAREACEMARDFYNLGGTFNDLDDLLCEAARLGIEVDG